MMFGLEKASREVQALAAQRRFDEAIRRAEAALAAADAFTPLHAILVNVHIAAGQHEKANQLLDDLVEMQPKSADGLDALAFTARSLGRHLEARDLYQKAARQAPHDPVLLYNLATSERTLGNLAAAEAACDAALTHDPHALQALLLRSELQVQTEDSNHVADLKRRFLADGKPDRDTMFIGYALGKEQDDLEDWDQAFDAFAAAADARRRNLSYDVATDEAKLARIAQTFSASQLSQIAAVGQSSNHIFILGLPRSGTTLVEHILQALPNVDSNGETDNVASALMQSLGPDGTDVFERAANADPETFAKRYEAVALKRGHAKKTIDKMPLNYLYIGAIHRAFPNAPILWVRRNPIDSCFAMFRTLFGEAYPFSYSFEDLARYYAAYERLMAHWTKVLPDRLYEIEYEKLVAEPDRVGKQIAEHCGLDWSSKALDLANNRAVSLTASSAQIRRPVYGTSSGRWRHYQRHLQPLIEALDRHGVVVPSDAFLSRKGQHT